MKALAAIPGLITSIIAAFRVSDLPPVHEFFHGITVLATAVMTVVFTPIAWFFWYGGLIVWDDSTKSDIRQYGNVLQLDKDTIEEHVERGALFNVHEEAQPNAGAVVERDVIRELVLRQLNVVKNNKSTHFVSGDRIHLYLDAFVREDDHISKRDAESVSLQDVRTAVIYLLEKGLLKAETTVPPEGASERQRIRHENPLRAAYADDSYFPRVMAMATGQDYVERHKSRTPRRQKRSMPGAEPGSTVPFSAASGRNVPTMTPTHELPDNDRNAVPVRILHLSDLHFHDRTDPLAMFQPLVADLQDADNGLGFENLDYLVVSGDFGNHAKPKEFEAARIFIENLQNRFKLPSQHCLIVPGNHDVDWDETVYNFRSQRTVDLSKLSNDSYLLQEKGVLLRDDALYPLRFKKFNGELHHPLLKKEYPLEFTEQCLPLLFVDHNIQFFAMNSCWQIDEYYPERSGINAGALARGLDKADKQLKEAKAGGLLASDALPLRIAIWHHPVTGNEKMEDTAFLERLANADVKICLHGHVHEERAELFRHLFARRISIVGGGSFGASAPSRPESTPRLYNVLEVWKNQRKIRVHTRSQRRSEGAWEGWANWPGPSAGARFAYYDIEY